MLGEQIGEFTGKVTSTRVLPGDDYRYVKVETSYQQQGTLCGVPGFDMGTVVGWERVPGQVFVEGQGISGGEGGGAIWNVQGVSTMTGEGMASSLRFSLAYQAPQEGPLSRLNGMLVIGEQESDNDGNIRTTLWEWK